MSLKRAQCPLWSLFSCGPYPPPLLHLLSSVPASLPHGSLLDQLDTFNVFEGSKTAFFVTLAAVFPTCLVVFTAARPVFAALCLTSKAMLASASDWKGVGRGGRSA